MKRRRLQKHIFNRLCFCLGGMKSCMKYSGVTGSGLGKYVCASCGPVQRWCIHFISPHVTGFQTQPRTATWSPASKASSHSKTSSGTSGGPRSCGLWSPRLRWSGRADTQVWKGTTYKLTISYHFPHVEDSWISSTSTAARTSTTNSTPSRCLKKQCRRRRLSFATTCRRWVWQLSLWGFIISSGKKKLSANLPLCPGRSRVPDHSSSPDTQTVSATAANRCQQGKKIHLSCRGTSAVQDGDHQDLQEVSCPYPDCNIVLFV